MVLMERREFLKYCGAFIACEALTIIAKPFTAITEAAPLTPPALPDPETPEIILKKYLARIEPVRKRLLPIVASFDLFTGFKNLSREQQRKDFNMYFHMYWAAKEKYEVPWQLLWIAHIHETVVSRDPDPTRSGFVGAMQRSSQFYPQEYVDDAILGWEHLGLLPQRYPDDFREIFFASKKMRIDAEEVLKNRPKLSLEEAILEVQSNYCAKWASDLRVTRYQEIKPLFDNPRATLSSRGVSWREWDDEASELPLPQSDEYVPE